MGRKGGEEVEAGHAEGMNHAVRAAREHAVGLANANQLARLAQGLAAGGTGGQAVVIGAFQVKIIGQMAWRRVQFLLELTAGVKPLKAAGGESGRVNRIGIGTVTL